MSEKTDLTAYATKAPTALHTGFAEWLMEQTGIDLSKKTKEQSFHEGVRLGVVLHGEYQRSDARKAARAAAKIERAQASMKKSEVAPRKISDTDKASKGGKNPKAKADATEAPKASPRKRVSKPKVVEAAVAASGEEADF